MEILISQGGLPIASRQLLDKCRTRVNEWRLQQRLPVGQITESWEQLLRWAQAHGQELNLDADAEVAAALANAMRELRQELEDGEDLVAGSVSPEEARLWLLCCQWIERGHTRLDPEHTAREDLQRAAARKMDVCLRLGVNHPRMIEEEMKRRRGVWDGNPAGILQDSKGRWRYGDEAEAIQRLMVDLSAVVMD